MNDVSLLSDAHKDAYGVRPSAERLAAWAALPVAEFEAVRAGLFQAVEQAIASDKAEQGRAVAVFETRISVMMAEYRISRSDAIRWDRQAYDAEGDDIGYYEYLTGLPYGYLTTKG